MEAMIAYPITNRWQHILHTHRWQLLDTTKEKLKRNNYTRFYTKSGKITFKLLIYTKFDLDSYTHKKLDYTHICLIVQTLVPPSPLPRTLASHASLVQPGSGSDGRLVLEQKV